MALLGVSLRAILCARLRTQGAANNVFLDYLLLLRWKYEYLDIRHMCFYCILHRICIRRRMARTLRDQIRTEKIRWTRLMTCFLVPRKKRAPLAISLCSAAKDIMKMFSEGFEKETFRGRENPLYYRADPFYGFNFSEKETKIFHFIIRNPTF